MSFICLVVTITLSNLRKRFTDQYNQDIVKQMVAETAKLDTRIPVVQLRGKFEFFCKRSKLRHGILKCFIGSLLQICASPFSVCIPCSTNFFTPTHTLLDAARRFFQSILETTALKDKGKYDVKVTQQHRRN